MTLNQTYTKIEEFLPELEARLEYADRSRLSLYVPTDWLAALIAEVRVGRNVREAAREMLAEIDAGHGCDRLIQMGLRAALSEHGRE